MTSDHMLQWDDNISLVSIGGQHITCFNGRTINNFWQDKIQKLSIVLPLKHVICCPPIETSEMSSSHWSIWSDVIPWKYVNGRTTDHMFQWEENRSPVSMGWQQITYFHGMTSDHMLQWDDNISLVSIGGQHITCFNGRTINNFWQDKISWNLWYVVLPLKQVKCCHPIETYDLMSSHGNMWSVVIPLKQVIQ
jgi:hypothetical protein